VNWRIDGWRVRTKVAVVLVVPAVVALVLGGLRVRSALDDAYRLSTLHDQLAVLDGSVTLADLVTDELVASVTAVDLADSQAAVDQQVRAVRGAAEFARLPAGVERTLGDVLGSLKVLRQQAVSAARDPVAVAAGYRAVITGLGGLVPDIVGQARADELDDRAASVRSLLLVRATLATEEALVVGGSPEPGVVAAVQDAAAEESVLIGQLRTTLSPAYAGEFDPAVSSAPARREALRSAIAAGQAAPASLLPALLVESTTLSSLRDSVFTALKDEVATRTDNARSDALRDSAIVLGALLAALTIALVVARSLLVPLRRLRTAALVTAHERLPDAVERVRAGEQIDWSTFEPVAVHTDEEIGQLAWAFDEMHQQAVRLASEQAELRRQVSEMFTTLSRRSQSLIELQLDVVEELESEEQDPEKLAALFRLDHLATRLRRNGENLQVLAGGSPRRRGSRPVTVVELLRAATSEVSDYRRIGLGHAPNGSVRAVAAMDVAHILAELLENAIRFSPPDAKVLLTADRGTRGGLLVEVVDLGLGMAPDDLEAANDQLAVTAAVGPDTTRRMGLYVVSKLAGRHGLTVWLRSTREGQGKAGITASVHVPSSLVEPGSTAEVDRGPAAGVLPSAVSLLGTGNPIPAASAPVDWFTPRADVASAAPRAAIEPAAATTAVVATRVAATTPAGLPLRIPGGRANVNPPTRQEVRRPEPSGSGFRDPESVRRNLSRHSSGLRAARRTTSDAESTEESS
jgi:signal transduction histidine kinase